MPQEVFFTNETLQVILAGRAPGGTALEELTMDNDGQLRFSSYSRLFGQDQNGNDYQLSLEADGSSRDQVILWDYTGGAQIRAAGEPATGEFRTLLSGKDAGGTVDDLRTNANQELIVDIQHNDFIQVDPVEIPVAEGILWNPGAAAAETYEVSFLVVNNDAGGAAVTVSVGVDIAAGGGLAAPEYWVFEEVVPYPGSLGWRGPFIIDGDDDVRGVASVANDASIHFRVTQIA